MSATSGGGGSVSEGSEAGGSSHSTMSVSDSPSTSFQTNLTENVTKITLSEENNAGGFAGNATGSKINLTLDEKHQKDGIVNVAFDYEEGANRGAGGGDFRSVNGSEKKDKVPEAVNLELVNMVPYSNGNGTSYGVPVNGIPVKKDSEQVDMSSPYDEYFVPVNEHKKYMRGEKLYVTKDKRRPTSWRRCLSWIVACTVISVVLIVAILAGTGVILSQDSNFVKEASVGRNFAGSNSQPSVTDTSSPIAEMYTYVPRSIESEFVIDNLDFDPAFKDVNSSAYQQFATTMENQLKMLLFNKEMLDFEASDVGLRIVNVSRDPFKVNYRIGWNYKQGITDPPEPIKMEDVRKRLVESLARNQGYIDKYHIDREAIKVNHVINACQMDNGGCSHICYYNYMNQRFTCTCPTHLVLDSSNKNCVAWTGSFENDSVSVPSHDVYPGMPYESTANPVHEYDFDTHHDEVHHGVQNSYDIGSEPSSELGSKDSGKYDQYERETESEPTAVSSVHKGGSYSNSEDKYDRPNTYSSQEINHYETAPERSAESNAEDKYHDYAVHSVLGYEHPSAEPTPEPVLEPTIKPKSEESDQSPTDGILHEAKNHEPSAEPTPEPPPEPTNSEGRGHDDTVHSKFITKEHEPESSSEPAAELTAGDKVNYNQGSHSTYGSAEYEPSVEATPEPISSQDTKHDGVHHSVDNIKVYQSSESTAEQTTDGIVPWMVNHSTSESKDHEPAEEPTPEPSKEPNSESKTVNHFEHSVNEFKDHDERRPSESTPNPTAHDKNHKPVVHSTFEYNDHEPSAEPTPEPSADEKEHKHIGHSSYGSEDHEPSAEPTPEPSADEIQHKHIGHSSYGSEEHEPSAEPTPEPSADEKEHKHIGHSSYGSEDHEPSAEPVPEPTPEPTADDKDHKQTDFSTYDPKEHEPSAEPTPEPSADGKEHKHIGHSSDGSEIHEPSAEPTPEPSADEIQHKHIGHSSYGSEEHEPSAEPTPEPSADEKEHKHIDHSSYGSEDHEPSAGPVPEPTPESTADDKHHKQTDLSTHASKDHEPSAEPTPEPTSDNKNHEYSVLPAKESKDHELGAIPTAEPTGDLYSETKADNHLKHFSYESKGNTPPTEASSESSATSDMNSNSNFVHDTRGEKLSSKPDSHSTSTDSSTPGSYILSASPDEMTGKTTQEPMKEWTLHSGLDYSQTQSVLGGKLDTDPASKSSLEARNVGNSENIGTTVHSVSAQENINTESALLLKPSHQQILSSQGQVQEVESKTENPVTSQTVRNESNHDGNYRQQVPYLEDILIRESSLNSENPNIHGQSQNPLNNVERDVNGQPVIEEIIIDKSKTSTSLPEVHSSNTVTPRHMGAEESSILNTKAASSESTDSPSFGIIGYSKENSMKKSVLVTETVQSDADTESPAIVEYTDGKEQTPGFGKPEFDRGIYDLIVKNNDPDHTNLSQSAGDNNQNPAKFETEKGQIHTGTNRIPVTTIHSSMQYESYTIPVAVEFLNSADNRINSNTKPELENHTEETVMKGNGTQVTAEGFKTINAAASDGRVEDTISYYPNGNKFVVDSTKAQETSTEAQLSMTTLRSLKTPEGVEKINDPHDSNLKVFVTENKTKSPNEDQGTTKSQEEISNNIKDELLDNDEFNTLLDKETTPGDGKDLLNKFPIKGVKTEKKKIKDYVKGEKTDSDRKAESTVRPPVTSEDFYLQKHVNGNGNIFDLDYSLQNQHTTKHDGGVTVIDPHGIEGIPGVSFKPHVINNHDLSVLQTVTPEFKTETVFFSGAQEPETLKPDPKNKPSDNKEGESKLDKEYKFDKDYKYDKQKVSKKKDLKKKVGGKDGKNVELDDGRKHFTEVTKDDWDVSQEAKDFSETTMNPSLDKSSVHSEMGINTKPVSVDKATTISESIPYKLKPDGSDPTVQSIHGIDETRTEVYFATEHPGDKQMKAEVGEHHLNKPSVDQSGHQIVDEPSVKSKTNIFPGTVYDGQLPRTELNFSYPETRHLIMNSTASFGNINGSVGTVYDGMPHDTTSSFGIDTKFENNVSPRGGVEQNTTFIVYESTAASPKHKIINSTTAHPTIIIHGQSGNLQEGHRVRFGNITFQDPINATVMAPLNETHTDGHSYRFSNYSKTFPNGSTVHPTIVIRGQSGALQDGHEARFGNYTFQTFTTSAGDATPLKNSIVYRIENATAPGTVFDGRFNPKNGIYHMFTNSSGTFVYTNASAQPKFIIKGESGDFGNSTAFILGNGTGQEFSGSFNVPQTPTFRNSSVFAMGNTGEGDAVDRQPYEVMSNETIQFTHQMNPSFVSSGTAYKVNNYFSYISKCAAGQFQCLNGTSKRGSACISLSSKCDSINDCSDGSDELGCIENGCPGNFQCSDSTCLKRNSVCNGILDCSDGSDEKNCESWKCEFDEFQCPSGRCIPVVWQCDNKPDCDNHTDEYNCQTSCGNDEYLCPEGWCIPLTYKCNGIKECINGEDEQLCDCSHEEFKCQTGGCVSLKQVCNGLDDCPDRSDEWDCVKLEPKTNLLKIRTPSGNYEPVCADNWTPKNSDEVCTSLGYYSSVPIEKGNSSITTETSFYVLKNDTTADFNKKIIVNLRKSEGICSSGNFVEIICQEFSCGSRSMTDSSSVEARLVGGMTATTGQWPSVALLYNIRNFHSCTANILTPRWVLASYNCLKMGNKNLNEQDWKFFGGSTVFEAEKANAETRKIISIIPHPQVKFNQFLFTNDLALVELDEFLQFTSKLGAVCLPEQEMQPRQICVTAGWGMNSPEDKTIRQQLQYLPVPTMNLTECNSTDHYSGFITDDKICAGYNSAQKSLCYNEEGAPLMCVNDRGEWELQGVLSYHSNCGRGSHPSIFSSITPVSDWIKKTIGNSFERKTSGVTKR